ncbi:MAG: efflux RND transporter permease subunit, partial [Bacteroidetes bacterium]|nr:efflux RND transporter permease subunit [Bacteroidota bacterium]
MRGILEFSVKYPIWGHMLILLLVGLGALCLSDMNVNFFPEFPARNVGINVAYPGASPQEMEEGIVLKIEQSLRGIQGIEQTTSVSSENFASITVEGLKGYDPDQLLSEVKNAVDRINSFPVAAEKPTVFRIKSLERVIVLLLKGAVDLLTLKRNAQFIEDELLASGVVSQVTVSGLPDYEFVVEVSENSLRRYGLTMDEIAAAIRRNNLDLSAGSLKSASEEVIIRSRNKRYDPLSLGNIIVRNQTGGGFIRVRDIGSVREQFAEIPNKSIYNGELAISITVNKTPEEDLITIADYVKEYAGKFNEKNKVLKLVVSNDRSTVIQQRIDLLLRNGRMGLFLVVLALTIFLNTRLSLWVAFSIPVAFMGMFVIAYLSGVTINVISLFGMILVVGILVDDGVVVSENIFTHYESGKSHFAAAVDGTQEVIVSVFASVSTTIVMFLPFFFLDGRLGEAFWQMAAVVVACLALSLVEAGFMLPSHLAHSKALSRNQPNRFRSWLNEKLDLFRKGIYAK